MTHDHAVKPPRRLRLITGARPIYGWTACFRVSFMHASSDRIVRMQNHFH
jgi:hypothetical protein